MIDFKEFLENRGEYNSNNLVIIDIQPEYEKYIHFSIFEFASFMKNMLIKGKKVLYFFNGETIGSKDSKESIIHWLLEHLEDYNEETYDLLYHNVIWRDKGYGFFRGWIDDGVNDATLLKFIRHMTNARVNDIRDLENDEITKLAAGTELPKHDPIYMPDISIPMLKQFNGSYLCGGGKDQCLKEVRLLFNAFNIRYTLFSKFIY